MSVKQTVDELLAKPMSRKAFLGQVGALLLAVVGVSSILKSLGVHQSQTSSHSVQSSQKVEEGYGDSAYGR
jgi:hypothetical protein